MFLDTSPIHIGEDVFIGPKCVIAAGAVVTHDIPAGVVAGGVPCKVIRPITEEDRIREENILF